MQYISITVQKARRAGRRVTAVCFALALLAASVPAVRAEGAAARAVQYLRQKPATPWTSIALAASGEPVSVDYLKERTGTSALEYEAPILAVAAAGEDPRTFPREDFVARLKSFYTGSQIGDAALLNDDAFGILALRAAGVPVEDEVLQGARAFLLAHQNTDGGWAYGVTTLESDTNTTAVALMALAALRERGHESVARGIGFLRAAQNDDGGFPYDPRSAYGTSSDASSDAWVVSALYALGENPAAWVKAGGATPLTHLASLQHADGYFVNQPGVPETSFTPTETAYALTALQGAWYPLVPLAAPAPFVTYRIEGAARTLCRGGARARDPLALVRAVASECGVTIEIRNTDYGPYLARIGTDAAEGTRGWLYTVNTQPGSAITVGAADYALHDDDEVLWYYGEWTWNLLRLRANATSVSSGGNVTFTAERQDAFVWYPAAGASVVIDGEVFISDNAGIVSHALSDGVHAAYAELAGHVRSDVARVAAGTRTELSIPLEVTLEAPPSDGNGGGGNQSSAGFKISSPDGTPPKFAFEKAVRGAALSREVRIANEGTRPIQVGGAVEGDALFREYLMLGGSSWHAYAETVPAGAGTAVEVSLTVPAAYQGSGTKRGTLVFWAIAL